MTSETAAGSGPDERPDPAHRADQGAGTAAAGPVPPNDPAPNDPAPNDPAPNSDDAPSDTVPADSAPVEAVPADSAPEHTVPVDSAPEHTVPVDSVPEHSDVAPADDVPGDDMEPTETADATGTADPAGTAGTAGTADETGPVDSTEQADRAGWTGAAGHPVDDPYEPASEPGPDPTAGWAGAPPPGGPPPGAGPGPGGVPFGGRPEDLPPITGFAVRHGLVRPARGKKIAGVCAGLGHATNTDPVLWRVVLTILAFFGGVGLLAYLVGWLVMPQQGDQVAPVESLVGRGRSSTSPLLTVLLAMAGIGLIFFVLNSGFRFTVLVAAVAATAAVFLTRRNQARSGTSGPTDPATDDATSWTVPMTAGQPLGGWPSAPTGTAPGSGWPGAHHSGPPQRGPVPQWRAPAYPAAGGPQPTRPHNWTVPPTGAQQPGYRAPFAPHGPYQPSTATATGNGEIPLAGWSDPLGPGTPPPPPPPPRGARPPKRPRERSLLGRVTMLVLLLVFGGLIALTATGANLPASVFFAAGLVVVGAGLVIGAWRGRARWLIIVGCVLAVGLPVSWVSERVTPGPYYERPPAPMDDQHWAPTSVDDLQGSYRAQVGDAVLDLSSVDFTGRAENVSINADIGDVQVILPPNVDTTVKVAEGVGNTDIFGTHRDGPHDVQANVTDLGTDGDGGGRLVLNLRAGLGDVEVSR